MLGSRWAEAAVLVRIIVPFYALSTVAAQCGAIMLANGRNAAMFWSVSGLSAGRVLAMVLGPFWGAVGVAWGIGAANVGYAIAMVLALGGTTGSSAWPLFRDVLAPLVASVVGGLVCYATIIRQPQSLGWLIASVGLGGCAFVICMALLQGRRMVSDIVAIRRIVFSRR